jgi:hypothetical protein
MGEELAARERQFAHQVELARRWLAQYADQGERLRHPARSIRAAIPTGEPLDAVHPLPAIPERFTVIAADGSQIQPDRHGAALYHLINVGSLVYRHGSGEAPEAHSEPTLGYTEAQMYENGHLVSGNVLDVRRDLAEITRLADLCAVEPPGPTIALVDGTLILWMLEGLPAGEQCAKVTDYLDHLDLIRQAGAVVAAFVSRPRRTEVTRLLYLASLDGDVNRANQGHNPLEHLPDRAVFGARGSAAWRTLGPLRQPLIHQQQILPPRRPRCPLLLPQPGQGGARPGRRAGRGAGLGGRGPRPAEIGPRGHRRPGAHHRRLPLRAGPRRRTGLHQRSGAGSI